MRVRVGCCGFARRFEEYAQHLDVVEVQQTFYRMPQHRTVERWRRRVPDRFEFTLKAWQLITHTPDSPTYRRLGHKIPVALRHRYGSFAPTREVEVAWQATLDVARALRATIVVFQCPARFGPTDPHVANLRHFFANVPREGLRFAWEPRGHWPPALVKALCRELDLIHCVDPFVAPSQYGDPCYYRMHGRGGYRYRYTDEDLQQLREMCTGPTYVLFNNVSMWDDAVRFLRLVGAA
ncbi:MAG: DUF72 domain-containing protein [Armatimonadota bacterium]|nr:DUF72 domain-containing protein [Armatimonadota bacterium]MDR5698039.1 DUF72 domain-containing protein [Armatimonadota bacterium]